MYLMINWQIQALGQGFKRKKLEKINDLEQVSYRRLSRVSD